MFSFKSFLGLRIFQSTKIITSQRQANFPVLGCSFSSKTVEEKLGLPTKPKRPLTPYFRYLKQIRPEVMEKNPKASSVQLVKMIAEKWQKVDESTKKKLEEEYKKDQNVYVTKLAKYDSLLTPEQRDDIKHLKQEIAESKEKRDHKKKIRELERPKRPASAFLRFLSEERARLPRGDMTYKEWQLKATENWNKLSEAQKNKYMQETKADIEVYKRELAKWEMKMVRLGHVDVVRNEALIEPTQSKPRRSSRTRPE